MSKAMPSQLPSLTVTKAMPSQLPSLTMTKAMPSQLPSPAPSLILSCVQPTKRAGHFVAVRDMRPRVPQGQGAICAPRCTEKLRMAQSHLLGDLMTNDEGEMFLTK